MQLEFHQLDRRWEHLRVRHPARQRRLLASLAEAGQQTPIVVVAIEGQADRYVVIDGYKRIAALEQLGRDTVEAVVRLLDTPEAVGQVFNVGSSREIRIHDLAVAVRDAVGSESPIVFLPYEDAYAVGFEDMARRVPDASKLERYTGFKPAITLEQTIADVIIDRRARLATA